MGAVEFTGAAELCDGCGLVERACMAGTALWFDCDDGVVLAAAGAVVVTLAASVVGVDGTVVCPAGASLVCREGSQPINDAVPATLTTTTAMAAVATRG